MLRAGPSRRLLDSLPAMIAYVDRDRIYRYANPAFRARYAHEADGLEGKAFEELAGELFPFLQPFVDGALAGEPQEFEVLGNAHATRGRWLRTTFFPDTTEEGPVPGFFAVVQDIHDGKSARLEHDRLRFACDQGLEGFALHDEVGRFTYVNPAMASMYGYTTDELLGESWRSLYPPEEIRRIEEVCFPELQERGKWHGELTGLRRTGDTFDVDISLSLLTDENGRPDGLACNSRDVTERKHAEESLRQLQRMDALGQLTGALAHDFNNLLAIILGNLQFLSRVVPDESDGHGLLLEAMDAAEHSASLTRRLLAFAREQPLSPVVLDVRGLVDGMENVLARSLGEDVTLSIEHDPGPAFSRTDQPQLQNALLNLVLNARDAIAARGQGGRRNVVRIRTGVAADAEGGPGWVLLGVSDTGVGMPAPVRERMFDPFFFTKEAGRGTGLGLSIVHGYVAQSGGRLEVDSEPGRGTRVVICLPRTADPVEWPAADETPCPPGDGERVLVIEDTEEVLRVVALMLESLGYRVLPARDAETAMRIARSGVALDGVLSDIRLADGVRGDELVARIQAHHPDLGVLFMSGHVGESESPRGARLLTKPFLIDDLAQAVCEALRVPAGSGS